MNTTEPLLGISQPRDAAMSESKTSATKPVGGELGQDQFMTLLVTQLKNQDPLQPLDNTQFISQLATFSSLEKLASIESILSERLAPPATNSESQTTPFRLV